MARILVSGCAGLIGFALCQRLLQAGHHILGVDNLSTGSRQHVDALCQYSGFTFLEQDICQPLPQEITCEQIYHLASPASPEDFQRLPLDIMRVNALGTWQLLDLAARQGAKLVFTSTSEVYGNPQEHPQRETYWGHVNPVGSRSCYDESKRFAEALITHHAQVHGTRFSIARVFNTYGPGMAHDGRVIPQFLFQALRGEPLTVHGQGMQTRSFCYVEDLVRGLQGLMESDQTDGEIYNLGNPQEYTIATVAAMVCELAGVPTRITNVLSPRSDDPERRCPDISKIQAAIGWRPLVQLREGLEYSLADFRRRFA